MEEKMCLFFNSFLAGMRNGKKVTLNQLGRGLCSVSMLKRLEAGSRMPGKMLRDRLMERLGIENDGYEDYLQINEYILWKESQKLLKAVAVKDMEAAKNILKKIKGKKKRVDSVEKQFCMMMEAQIYRCEGASEETLRDLFGKALECTVPNVAEGRWTDILLSVKEWNLLLEYVHYGGNLGQKAEDQKMAPGGRTSLYEWLLGEIDKADMDLDSNAKIYPKAVYYLCMEEMKAPEENWECGKLLLMCREALEMLRSAEKLYYLDELLECMERLYVRFLARQKEILKRIDGYRTKEAVMLMEEQILVLDSELTQVREWRAVLEALYRSSGVSCRMENDCYLYWQSDNYSIGDVVRRRRKLLGMSVRELSEGICDEKTIRRLENGRTKVQMKIMVQLFEKLKLSPEYQRKAIVTGRYEALVLYRNLAKALNNYEVEDYVRYLAQLKGMLDMDDLVNRQKIEGMEILHQLFIEQISETECVNRMRKGLECFVPLENLESLREGYLSCGELEWLYGIAIRVKGAEQEQYIRLLHGICRQYEDEDVVNEHIGMYELVMRKVASYLGDRKDYKQSNEIADRIIKKCLALGRMNMLYTCVYCKFWNQKEQLQEKGTAVPDFFAKQELQKCIQLAKLSKATVYEEFYTDKLKQYGDFEFISQD